jgi:CRP-like cAMP-binding protein
MNTISLKLDRSTLGALFEAFSDEAIARLASQSEVLRFEANAMIFDEGLEARKLYILHSGRVAIEIRIDGENRFFVHTAAPREVFGWSALVPPFSLTASARAVEPSTIIAISASALEDEITREPNAGLELMKGVIRLVSTRLKDTRLQLVNILHWPAVPHK